MYFCECSSFCAEIHMVHWNSKYDNFTYASAQDDGLAVLTIFVEVSSCNQSLELYKYLGTSTSKGWNPLHDCDSSEPQLMASLFV